MRTLSGIAGTLLAVLFLAAAGCSSSPKGGTPRDAMVGVWTLTMIEGQPVADLLPAAARVPTLEIGPEGAVGGFGGVNHLSSRIDLSPGQPPVFAPIISTRMAGPPELMKLEGRYTALLQGVNGSIVESTSTGRALTLLRDGKTALEFAGGARR